MTEPGGRRRENRNGVLDRDPQGAESLDGAHEFADLSEDNEVRRDGDQGDGLVRRSDESRRDAPSGVWLAAEDGTILFHPISAAAEGVHRWPGPEADTVEEADEKTLDAACRLMPLLPRELIAEYLKLGLYRDGGDAT
ncbi:hypothetical protein [Streptomyces sp. NPDC005784]|uniref:hypothetical protein n=1 Tax=Streptomyces sp. NPDC005784 TaxID=3364731 RepID=UPI00369390FD